MASRGFNWLTLAPPPNSIIYLTWLLFIFIFSITECVVIWFGIVLVVLPSIEVLHFATFEYKEWETQMQDRSNTGILGCFSKLPVIVIELYRILGYFFIGALGCLLTTELAKYKIGRLRPYYLTGNVTIRYRASRKNPWIKR